MAIGTWAPMALTDMRSTVPLLDLTALLVVYDLGILDALFRLFGRIAVGKATLFELLRIASPISGSLAQANCAGLLAALHSQFDKIEQPSAEPPTADGFAKERWASEEVIAIIRGNARYTLYSEDAMFRVWAAGGSEDVKSMCTLDVLLALDEQRLMGPKIVVQHIARLCAWRVGLVVPLRYQIAVIPDRLKAASSIRKAVDVLGEDKGCNALFSSIWNPKKSYGDIQGHGASLLLGLAEDQRNRMESVCAVGAYWLSKAGLHRMAPMDRCDIIASVVVHALVIERPLAEEISQRLWSVYRTLVEFAYATKMDDEKYDESIRKIVKEAVKMDRAHTLTGERSVVQRLRIGVTEDTSDYEKFNGELTKAKLVLGTSSRQ